MEKLVEVRKMVYQTMIKRYSDENSRLLDKIMYLRGNLKFFFNDLNRLVVLEAIKGKPGLFREIEDNLREILKDMLSLAAKYKDSGQDVLVAGTTRIAGSKELIRLYAIRKPPAAPLKAIKQLKSKNHKN